LRIDYLIDWFASKTGMIIFVLIVGGVLLLFANAQNSIYENSITVQQVNDLAKLVDELCDGCTFEYDFGKERSVSGSGNTLIVDDIEREVVSDLEGSVIGEGVVIKNENGKVTIK